MITNKGGEKPWHLDIQPGGRGHKRYKRRFKTKALAKQFEAKLINRVLLDDSYQIPKKDNRKLEVFINLWFSNTGQFLSSGVDSKNRMLKASFLMGSPLVRTFKPVLFLDYRSKRIDCGVAAATMNRELQTFKTVFNNLVDSGQFEGKNPFSTIRKIKTHQPKTVFLSAAEINNLFNHLRLADSDAYLISLLCLSTGARWGEAQNLYISDCNNSSVTYHYTKSKKSRTVFVQAGLYSQLIARLKQGAFNDSYSTFTRRLKDSGIELPKGQRTHILRHTFASHYMINGGGILELQEILGHSSLEMTMKYAHLAPDSMQKILELNPSSYIGCIQA